MNSLPPQLGPPLKIASCALLVTLFLLLVTVFIPTSKGDKYFNSLNHYHQLVLSSQYQKADQLAKQLDSLDILYFSKHNHPSFIAQTIKDILKKPNRSTDDLIEVALLYKKIGDNDNSRHFLLLAKQQDPIRSDIDTLLRQLSF